MTAKELTALLGLVCMTALLTGPAYHISILTLTEKRLYLTEFKVNVIVLHEYFFNIYMGIQTRNFPIGDRALVVLQHAIGIRDKGFVFINPETGDRHKAINKSFDRATTIDQQGACRTLSLMPCIRGSCAKKKPRFSVSAAKHRF